MSKLRLTMSVFLVTAILAAACLFACATIVSSASAQEEAELAATPDPTLGQRALELVRQATYPMAPLTQRQAYINVRYIPK